jgi:hypothetical protein
MGRSDTMPTPDHHQSYPNHSPQPDERKAIDDWHLHINVSYQCQRVQHLDSCASANKCKVSTEAKTSSTPLTCRRYIHINEIYDRVEKVLYLVIDAVLNVYFIRTVKANLVSNGLQKYDKLVRFNCVMIVISLLMDLVILGTMSLPNGFV